MTKIMTPSQKPITDGQINKAVAAYKAMLEKHRIELGSGAAQFVLGQDKYINKQVGVLRECIELMGNIIVRKVKVNRNLTPQQVLKNTGIDLYADKKIVETMPKGEGDEVEIVFFNLGHWISDKELKKEYSLRGLKPADPYSLCAVIEANLAFVDEHPNVTYWKIEGDDQWCFVAFDPWYTDGRGIFVSFTAAKNGWPGDWWFAGLRE
jgi:hypothetical protein